MTNQIQCYDELASHLCYEACIFLLFRHYNLSHCLDHRLKCSMPLHNSIGFAFAISKILFHFVECDNVFVWRYNPRDKPWLYRDKDKTKNVLEVKELTAHWNEPEPELHAQIFNSMCYALLVCCTKCALCTVHIIKYITNESTLYSKSNKFEAIQTIYILYYYNRGWITHSKRFKIQKDFNIRFKHYYQDSDLFYRISLPAFSFSLIFQ